MSKKKKKYIIFFLDVSPKKNFQVSIFSNNTTKYIKVKNNVTNRNLLSFFSKL